MTMGYQQNWIKKERKFFIASSAFLLVLFALAMIQNVIRYGASTTYSPVRSVTYLLISLLLFLSLLPSILQVSKLVLDRYPRYYVVSAIVISISSILIFYAGSGAIMYLLGFFDDFFNIKYARQYFGREALFHLILVIGACVYIFFTYQKKARRLVRGSVGRKSVTIQTALIRYVEADDHYLKLYTEDSQLVKRSTMDKMSEELEPEFIRIHRKYLVNTSFIIGKEREQRDEYVLLEGGIRLKVGRSYQPLDIETILNETSKLKKK